MKTGSCNGDHKNDIFFALAHLHFDDRKKSVNALKIFRSLITDVLLLLSFTISDSCLQIHLHNVTTLLKCGEASPLLATSFNGIVDRM